MAYELHYICFCETSQQMFRDWLRMKYANITALNRTWGTQYHSFARISAPATQNARPVDEVNRAAWYDWACFNNRRFTDHLKWVKTEMRKFNQDIFRDSNPPPVLHSNGLVQSLDPGNHSVLARFDDGKPALPLVEMNRGSLYYLAAPLQTEDYHLLLSPLGEKLGLTRPVVGIDPDGRLVTGAEVRGVERKADYLVYASNLTAEPVEFELRGSGDLGEVTDLRSLHKVPEGLVRLGPFQETLFQIEKSVQNK